MSINTATAMRDMLEMQAELLERAGLRSEARHLTTETLAYRIAELSEAPRSAKSGR
jgi:hypothetical protein